MNAMLFKEFFMWCTAINFGLLIFSAIMCWLGRGLIQRVHNKMFGLAPEAINAFIYGYLGLYKVLFIVFNLVPWIALSVMAK